MVTRDRRRSSWGRGRIHQSWNVPVDTQTSVRLVYTKLLESVHGGWCAAERGRTRGDMKIGEVRGKINSAGLTFARCAFTGADQTVVHQSPVVCSDSGLHLHPLLTSSRCTAGVCAFPHSVPPCDGPHTSPAENQVMWNQHLWPLPWCFFSCGRRTYPLHQPP